MRTIRKIAEEADLGMGCFIDAINRSDICIDGHLTLEELRELVAAIEQELPE